jgi:hypothetical protein
MTAANSGKGFPAEMSLNRMSGSKTGTSFATAVVKVAMLSTSGRGSTAVERFDAVAARLPLRTAAYDIAVARRSRS